MMPLYGQKKLFGTSCFTKRGEIRKILAYKNSANNVKCILCNGNAELWNPSKGCPICGNVLEKQENYMIFAD